MGYNSQRLYTVTEPTITRPLEKTDTPAAGFYALNGGSVLQFPSNQKKERICAYFEEIREQNPGQRILLVLDNFSSHMRVHARTRTRTWNRPRLSFGWLTASQPSRAGLEKSQMEIVTLDCGGRG